MLFKSFVTMINLALSIFSVEVFFPSFFVVSTKTYCVQFCILRFFRCRFHENVFLFRQVLLFFFFVKKCVFAFMALILECNFF